MIALHAAADEIELSTGKSPTADDLTYHVLSGRFKHRDFDEQPDKNKPIKQRELKLSNGGALTPAKIKRSCDEVIFPKQLGK